jgi:pimeloyl-ACP methyl ester carboxylesterase
MRGDPALLLPVACAMQPMAFSPTGSLGAMESSLLRTELSYASRVIDGARIHWCELPGDPTRTPLLLLHGLHDSHLTWKQIAPRLARGRRVLMPDLLGCGLSERPDASYELKWHAGMIAKWLQMIGVSEVDVVGHSFGGGIGQMLLLERSLRVRRLALLASGGLGRDVGVWLRLAAVSSLIERFGQPFMAHGTRLALRSMHRSLAAEDLERLAAMNARKGTARAFARTVRDVIDWRGQRRLFAQHAHQIAAFPPVAICWGDRDEIIPIAHGLEFAKIVDGVRFHRVDGAGHWLHHEKPDQIVETLQAFLEEAQCESIRLRPKPKSLIARTAARLRSLLRGFDVRPSYAPAPAPSGVTLS